MAGTLLKPSNHSMAPLQRHEMELVRKVYDEEVASKKFASIVSPRVDAQMVRNGEKLAIPCECIVELYELLWRWGHRNTEKTSFAQHFGFAIPDTVVVIKGRPYAWYFISKKDGSLLRKAEGSLSVAAIEKKLCREPTAGESPVCAVWMPMASQFSEARCHSPYVEFFGSGAARHFMSNLRISHSGIFQAFVEPSGVSNFLVRTVRFRDETSLCVRSNRALLVDGKGQLFDRAATFEGWAGLSGTSNRYRSHRLPHMEELMLEAGKTLSQRIEQERVGQMLFLQPSQHVALHFKVSKDDHLMFVYASIISEREVILQTRPQLLMGDPCMTEALANVALLQGGTRRKSIPDAHQRSRSSAMSEPAAVKDEQALELEEEQRQAAAILARWVLEDEADGTEASSPGVPGDTGDTGAVQRSGSLPPLPGPGTPRSIERSRQPAQRGRQPLSARCRSPATMILPKMGFGRPEVPAPPFQQLMTFAEVGRTTYTPAQKGMDVEKRPLVAMKADPSPRNSGRPPVGNGSLTDRSDLVRSGIAAERAGERRPSSSQKPAIQGDG
mmetsp:Transcript_14436/g.31636  ORF Transcript_14436/g.31636 Transcript_14436/m.31636 type:complete len:556 (-) Transcript_14436:22-1689(-)